MLHAKAQAELSTNRTLYIGAPFGAPFFVFVQQLYICTINHIKIWQGTTTLLFAIARGEFMYRIFGFFFVQKDNLIWFDTQYIVSV